jgi:hypothetical protein
MLEKPTAEKELRARVGTHACSPSRKNLYADDIRRLEDV